MKKIKNSDEICSSNPCDYCACNGKRSCQGCYEYAGFQGLRLKKIQTQDASKNG